jgi:hypothetical protein
MNAVTATSSHIGQKRYILIFVFPLFITILALNFKHFQRYAPKNVENISNKYFQKNV